MGEFIGVNPTLEGYPAQKEFQESDGSIWTHALVDENGTTIFFGDYAGAEEDDVVFSFCEFKFAIAKGSLARLTWAQARELGETIVALADKHEGKE